MYMCVFMYVYVDYSYVCGVLVWGVGVGCRYLCRFMRLWEYEVYALYLGILVGFVCTVWIWFCLCVFGGLRFRVRFVFVCLRIVMCMCKYLSE